MLLAGKIPIRSIENGFCPDISTLCKKERLQL